MSNDMLIRVGGSAWDDGAAFLDAIRRSEAGEAVSQRLLSFESFEAMTALVTKARFALLRHLHANGARSINALAVALGRPYRRVHDDVVALEQAGLIERAEDHRIRTLFDGFEAKALFGEPRRPEAM